MAAESEPVGVAVPEVAPYSTSEERKSRLKEEGGYYPYYLRRVVSFCPQGGWHPRMRKGRELLYCCQTLAWIYDSEVDSYLLSLDILNLLTP